jgi:hypothetical protein
VTFKFGEAFIVKGETLQNTFLWSAQNTKKKKKKKKRKRWHLTGVEEFNIGHCLVA